MHRLGFPTYVAQGGDWGAQVTTRIGALDPEHCAAIHLNMALGSPPPAPDPLTEEEQADLAAMKQSGDEESGYAHEQGTKPQTLGVAVNDSPAGLLAWIVEEFRTWSDCDGNPENCFTRHQLITNVMPYWVTQTSASSARLYWETRHQDSRTKALPFLNVPTGVARYPKEVLRWPRSWVERQYNVVRWTVMERGEHFRPRNSPNCLSTTCASTSESRAEGPGRAFTQAWDVSRVAAPARADVHRCGSVCR
jgi:pimeloyl-ACP methyl ester carboxylesterase